MNKRIIRISSSLATFLFLGSLIPLFPFVTKEAYAASVAASITKVQGNVNSTYIEFSVPLASNDVLFKTGFESGDPDLDNQWHGTGNQSYVSTAKGRSLRLSDTVTNQQGNYFDAVVGETKGTYSMSQYPIKSIKADSRLTMQYDLKVTGDDSSILPFFGNLWKNKGDDFFDISGNPIVFTNNTTFTTTSPPSKFYIRSSNGNKINLEDGVTRILISSKDENYGWGYAYYRFNAADNSMNLRSDLQTELSAVSIGGSGVLSSRAGGSFISGDQLRVLSNFGDIWAGYKEFKTSSDWTTYNTSFDLPVTGYSPENYGVRFFNRWYTNGEMLLDNIKIGYAEKAILYRNGAQVYSGYDSNFTDTGAIDRTAPSEIADESLRYNYLKDSKQVTLGWDAPVDRGTQYTYTIQGQLRNGTLGDVQDPKVVTVTSGVKGYIITSDNSFTTSISSGSISTTGTGYTFTPTAGNPYVHIAPVDYSGNIGETKTMVLVDGDKPTLTLTASTLKNTNKEVMVSVTATDSTTWITNITLPNGVQIASGKTSFIVNENGTYNVTTTDFFGNSTTERIIISNIDKLPPVIAITPNTVSWQPDDIDINVNVTDNFPLMGSTMKYIISNSATFPDSTADWIVSDSLNKKIKLSKNVEGQFYVHVQAVDATGNITTKTSGIYQIKPLPKPLSASDVNIVSPSSNQLKITVPVADVSYQILVNNLVYIIPKGSGVLDVIGVQGGHDYPITITPINESGGGLPFTTVGTTRPDASFIQSITPIVGKDGPVSITIKELAGVDRYDYVITDNTGSIVKTLSNSSMTNEFDLSPNAQYTFDVVGVNRSGMGLPAIRTFLTVPTVAGLSITDIHEQDLQLSWATVTGDSYYGIVRNDIPLATVTNATYTSTDGDVAGPANGSFHYLDQSLESNRFYSYMVKASNSSGSSKQYNITGKTLPSIPDVNVVSISSTGSVFRFKPLDGVVYDIFENGILKATVKDQYEFLNLDSGTLYTYEVLARNVSGSGQSLSFTILTKPGTPKNILTSNYTTTSVLLSVDALTSVDEYVVDVNGQTIVSKTPDIALMNLLPGQSYKAIVHGVNQSGVSSTSAVVFHTLPESVTPLISNVNEDDLTISWPSVDGAIRYELETPTGLIMTEKNELVLPSPGAGVYATYGIRTVGVSGVNLDTKQVSTVGSPILKTSEASVLKVTRVTDNSARLYWPEFEGAVAYRLYDGNTLVGTTTDTVYDLSKLISSTTYKNFMIQAVSGGITESRKYGVTFETLSFGGFTADVRNITRSEAELYATGILPTDTLVIKSFDNNVFSDVYDGPNVSLPLLSLNADTTYTYYLYTRNHSNVLSDPHIVTFKTKEKQAPNEPVHADMPMINPNTPTKDTEIVNIDPVPESTVSNDPADLRFTDINGRFSEDAIYKLASKGVLNGYDDGTFRPKASVTRAEFIMMLDNAGYLPPFNSSSNSKVSFPDVLKDSWYADSIGKAAAYDIVDGYPSGRFKPDQILSRAEVAKILAKVGITSQAESVFSDEDSLPTWAKKEINQVGGAGIFIGYDGGKFLPKKTITREESALVIYRLLDN